MIAPRCSSLLAFSLGTLFACSSVDAPPDPVEVARHLDYLDRSLEAVNAEAQRQQWELFTTGATTARRVPGGSLAVFDQPSFAAWRGHLSDAALSWRVELAYRATLHAAVAADPRIRALGAALAGRDRDRVREFGGAPSSDAALQEVIRTDPDRGRREAAFRSRYVAAGAAAKGELAQLLVARTSVARTLGFADFHELELAGEGLDGSEVAAWLALLDQRTTEPARARARRLEQRASDGVARAWDEEYELAEYLAQVEPMLDAAGMLSRARSSVAAWGLPIDDLPITIDAESRPGRSQHFFAFRVSVPGDIRLLVTPATGLYAQRATLHELGHALAYASVDADLPFLTRLPPSSAFAEGVGKIFERLPYEAEWLTHHAGVAPAVARRVREYSASDELFRIRRFLAGARFEREAYADPTQDLGALFARVMRETTFIDWSGVESAWASDLHLTTQPLFNLDYIVARLIQAQVYEALERRLGRIVDEPRVGEILRVELFEVAGTRPWSEVIAALTGGELEPLSYLRRELAAD